MLKRLLVTLSIAIGALLLAPTPHADASWGWWSSWWSRWQQKTTQTSGYAVPELDPDAAGSAMTLLLGGIAIVASRRRKEDLV